MLRPGESAEESSHEISRLAEWSRRAGARRLLGSARRTVAADGRRRLRHADLTHELSSESVFWPTGETFKLTTVADGVTEQDYYYASNSFSGNEHGGTHLDAPVHFTAGKWTTDQIPLDRLIGSAVVVDVSAASAANADYQVAVADFIGWEATHGAIEPADSHRLRKALARCAKLPGHG